MKKSLLALAILGVATGAAHAASSVTLYGVAEIAYTDSTKDGQSVKQSAPGESRIGFKGTEDLGNGMAAIFKLESRYNLDTGSNAGQDSGSGFFDEQSWVGLSLANGMHTIRVGKSNSPIDVINNNVGHLVADYATKSSMGGWRNGLYYDFASNGWTAGAAVTTKGGAAGDSTGTVVPTVEGAKGTKSSYGAYVKYAAPTWYAGASWQADNDINAATGALAGIMGVKNEWMVNGGVTFKPVTIGAADARAKRYSDIYGGAIESGGKRTIWQAHILAALTPSDTVYLNYQNIKGKGNSGVTYEKQDTWGLGYIHSLSKRTSVFAAVARVNAKVGSQLDTVNGELVSTSGTGKATKWDIGVRHTF